MKTQRAPAFANPETQLPLFKMEKYFQKLYIFLQQKKQY